MDYFVYENGELVRFDAARFIREHKKNKKVLSNLRSRLRELETYGISALKFDSVKVQTSNIADPTAELALMATHLKKQIVEYEYWLSVYDKTMCQMSDGDRYVLETMLNPDASHPLYSCMEHFHLEKSAIYELRSHAIKRFSELVVGEL